jgi:hypothetical protein
MARTCRTEETLMSSLLKSPWTWVVTAAVMLGVLALVFLSLTPSYSSGVREAYADHARGHYEIKTYGIPAPWDDECDRLLQEKYRVRLRQVAGCVVSHQFSAYVRGYNEASTRLLREKYGRDVFEECNQLARQKWEAAERNRERGQGNVQAENPRAVAAASVVGHLATGPFPAAAVVASP